jgi:hypothetical protein
MAHHAVEPFHDLANADFPSVKHEQQGPHGSHRQAHDRASQHNHAAQADPDPSLPRCFPMQIHRGLVLLLAAGAPAIEDPMRDDLDRLRLRQLDFFFSAGRFFTFSLAHAGGSRCFSRPSIRASTRRQASLT